MRLSIALLMIVLAGLLTFPASMAAWEQRDLINEQGFVTYGNKVLSRPEVQQELANEITTEVGTLLNGTGGLLSGSGGLLNGVTGGSDITGLIGSLLGEPAKPTPGKPATTSASPLNSLIQPIALDVISSLPNSDIANEALKATHSSVISAIRSKEVKAEHSAIVLDLGPEVGDVLRQVQLVSPAQTAASAGKLVLLKPGDLASAFRYARFLDGKTLILSALPLLLVIGAIVIAPNRIQVPLYAGIAVAASAGLWILLVKGPLRPWVVNRISTDEGTRRTARIAYDVITGGYIRQELIVMGVGVVIAVAGVAIMATTSRRAEPSSATIVRTI